MRVPGRTFRNHIRAQRQLRRFPELALREMTHHQGWAPFLGAFLFRVSVSASFFILVTVLRTARRTRACSMRSDTGQPLQLRRKASPRGSPRAERWTLEGAGATREPEQVVARNPDPQCVLAGELTSEGGFAGTPHGGWGVTGLAVPRRLELASLLTTPGRALHPCPSLSHHWHRGGVKRSICF